MRNWFARQVVRAITDATDGVRVRRGQAPKRQCPRAVWLRDLKATSSSARRP